MHKACKTQFVSEKTSYTSDEFINTFVKKGKGKKRVLSPTANKLTEHIIGYVCMNGCDVWRQNNHGVFNVQRTAKNLYDVYVLNKRIQVGTKKVKGKTVKQYVNGRSTDLSDIYAILKYGFQKNSVGRKGVSDIIGFVKNCGVSVYIEIKVGKDDLSIEQTEFLRRINRHGGIGIEARNFDDFKIEFDKKMKLIKTKTKTDDKGKNIMPNTGSS